MGQKQNCNGCPIACASLNNYTLLLWWLFFFCKISWLWSSLHQSLRVLSSQATAIPFLGHTLNSTFQPPALLHTRIHTTQAGVHRAAAQSTYTDLTLSFLPQTVCCVPIWSLEALSLSQLISPLWEYFSEWRNLSSLSAFYQVLVPSHFFFLLSYVVAWGYFPVFLGIQGLLLVFNRYLVRIVTFIDVLLMYLWEKTNPTYYPAILTLLPFYDYYLLKISFSKPSC